MFLNLPYLGAFWNAMTNSSIRPSPLLLGKTPLGMRCFVIAINVASQSINIHVEHCMLLEHLQKNISFNSPMNTKLD